MAESLVGEVAAWLGTPVAAQVTAAERLVLLLIAERCHKTSRRMLSHRGDLCVEVTVNGRSVAVVESQRSAHQRDQLAAAYAERGHVQIKERKMTLTELLACRAGLQPRGLSEVVQRLAGRGIEVRVPIGKDSLGRPMFARRGHAVDYWLPPLPAMVSLPAASGGGAAPQGGRGRQAGRRGTRPCGTP